MRKTACLLALTQVALFGFVGLALATTHRAVDAAEAVTGARRGSAVRVIRGAQGWAGFRTVPVAAGVSPAAADRVQSRFSGSVVTVDAYKEADDEPLHRKGTGVIATRSGYIFAPLFVVDEADFLIVNFGAEARSPARIIARDPKTMLAVLKVSFPPRECDCPSLGDGTAERSDAPVVMLSRDAGSLKATSGNVVGLRAQVGPLSDVLEVAMPQAPGELGGVLISEQGQLIGLALATADGPDGKSGVRVFALPASRIRAALNRMLEDKGGAAPGGEPTLSSA